MRELTESSDSTSVRAEHLPGLSPWGAPAVFGVLISTIPPVENVSSSLSPSAVVSILGLAVHFGGSSMLVALFLLLRRYQLRRGYFGAWTVAWISMTVAILALVVRYNLLPSILGHAPAETSFTARGLYFTYQVAKLLAFLLFVVGTHTYVAGGHPRARIRVAAIVALAYAIISTTIASNLNALVVWQSPLAAIALGYCSWVLLRLPRSRRSLGSLLTGTGFALVALLWVGYSIAFGGLVLHAGAPGPRWAQIVVTINSYLDFFVDVMLGYGMIVLLMDDGRREVGDAQAELRLAHDQLRRTAFIDPLTEALNRRAFDEGVGLEMARAFYGCVVLADLDDLKDVNDRYGHAAGDRLLRACSDALRTGLRPYDKLYRWGGDEFLIVLPSGRATEVQGRLDALLEHAPAIPLGPGGPPVRLRVSVGSADYASAESIDAAIERADRAMYAEKSRRKTPRNITPPMSSPPVSPVGR